MKDLAVIIPCFNSEATISRAIQSVLCQVDALSKLTVELIVVDDGSSDTSLDIVGKFKSPMVKTISNQRAKGVSGARNTGLLNSNARWITFLDSDDMLAPNALLTFHEYEQNDQSEILAFNAKMSDSDRGRTNTILQFHNVDVAVFDERKSEYASAVIGFPKGAEFCSVRGMMGVVWSVFFSSNLVSRIKLTFDERLSFMEDLKFKLTAILSAQTVTCYTEPVYCYSLSPSSSISRIDNAREQSLKLLMKEASRKIKPFNAVNDDARQFFLCKCFLQIIVDEFDCSHSCAPHAGRRVSHLTSELRCDVAGALSVTADSFTVFQKLVLSLGVKEAYRAIRLLFRLKHGVRCLFRFYQSKR